MYSYYLKNRYTIITIITLLLTIGLSYILRSNEMGLFNLIFNFDTSAPDLNGDGVEIYKQYVNAYIRNIDINMSSAIYYFTPVACIFPSISILMLHDEIHSGFINYSIYRKNIKKVIIRKASISIICSSIISIIPLLLYLSIFYIVSDASMEIDTSGLSLLSDILKFNIADISVGLYYVVYIMIYFVFCTSYSTLATGLSMLIEKKYIVILVPYIYYSMMSYSIPNWIDMKLNTNNALNLLGTHNTIVSFGIPDISTISIIAPLIVPFFIGIILIHKYIKRIRN